jgi:hypothetical protein
MPLQEQWKNPAICKQHTTPTDFLSLDEYHNLKDSITGNSNSHQLCNNAYLNIQ